MCACLCMCVCVHGLGRWQDMLALLATYTGQVRGVLTQVVCLLVCVCVCGLGHLQETLALLATYTGQVRVVTTHIDGVLFACVCPTCTSCAPTWVVTGGDACAHTASGALAGNAGAAGYIHGTGEESSFPLLVCLLVKARGQWGDGRKRWRCRPHTRDR